MGRLPDLTGLFLFAAFGMVVAFIGGIGLVGWLGYHLFRALALYLGGAA